MPPSAPLIQKSLTGKQKRYLRGLAHLMNPLVSVGKNGLSRTLYEQIDQCLLEHELIKIKILNSCPMDKKECSRQISMLSRSHVAQIIGRTLLLYRSHPEKPVIQLPQ